MGWMMVFAWKPLAAKLPSEGMTYLMIGGLLYTFGAIFYVWRGFRYHHAIWHLFVIAGTVLHFFCILFYVLPIR